jgi:hypothetical protein
MKLDTANRRNIRRILAIAVPLPMTTVSMRGAVQTVLRDSATET